MWERYVAVGDSFTEGIGDIGPDGVPRGWADRFAEESRHNIWMAFEAALFGCI